MTLVDRLKRILRMCGHAATITVHERLDLLEASQDPRLQATLLRAALRNTETLKAMAENSPICIEEGDSPGPEAALLSFLYSFLPSRNAVVVDSSDSAPPSSLTALLETGYQVYWCVTNEGTQNHSGKIPSAESFHTRSLGNGSADLILNLATMCSSSDIPRETAILSIRAEGRELAILGTMGTQSPPVVSMAFADSRLPFAQSGSESLEDLIPGMKGFGYHWYVVIYRTLDSPKLYFYANHLKTPRLASGHAFFFSDYPLFSQAQSWCTAVLRRVYFQPSQDNDES